MLNINFMTYKSLYPTDIMQSSKLNILLVVTGID